MLASLIVRIIVFAIAISAVRSVLNYVRGVWFGLKRAQPRGSVTASTVLKKDPVCGTYVAVNASFKKIARGQVYHFCSAECRSRFAA